MEIIHRVDYRDSWEKDLRIRLERENIKYKLSEDFDKKDGLVVFNISESHQYWKPIEKKLRSLFGWFIYGDTVDTYFLDSEILNSEWSRIHTENAKKYPEPFNTWAVHPHNYDRFCNQCGTHVQARPFRIQKETNWGNFHFFTFITGQGIFAPKKVFDEFSRKKIRGVVRTDVLINHTGKPAEDIFQFTPAHTTRGGLVEEKKMKVTWCRKCGNKKFSHHDRGAMKYKRDPRMEDADVLYTNEWFGPGGRVAWREIIVSNKVSRLILEQGWKGIRLKAVDIV